MKRLRAALILVFLDALHRCRNAAKLATNPYFNRHGWQLLPGKFGKLGLTDIVAVWTGIAITYLLAERRESESRGHLMVTR